MICGIWIGLSLPPDLDYDVGNLIDVSPGCGVCLVGIQGPLASAKLAVLQYTTMLKVKVERELFIEITSFLVISQQLHLSTLSENGFLTTLFIGS